MTTARGATYARRFRVGAEHTAKHIAIDGVGVLATPFLVGFMEETCRLLAQQYLPEGYTTVGSRVEVHHVRPAVQGAEVEIRALVLYSDEKRAMFWVEAWSGAELIGYALHERVVVKLEEFAQRLKANLASRAGGSGASR